MALYRRKESSAFQYDFTVAGVRYRGTTGEKTQARAKLVEAELMIKARHKQLLSGTRRVPSFQELAQEFTDHIEQTRLMPGTIRYYKTGLAMLQTKPLAHMRVDRIDERTIDTTSLAGSGSHVNCALRTLSRMLHLAQEWNLLAKVPKVKLARERRRNATFDAQTEKVVLDGMRQPWRDVFLLMEDAGMRNEEAVATRWEYINFARSIIFNPRVKAEDTDGWVPMSERLKQALKARHRGQKQGWVFPSKRSATGHIWANVSREFSRVREEHGLSKQLVPYSARHTFATNMLEMTGDPVFVGKLIGHKNPLTTTRYLHPSLLKAKQLIDRRNEQAAETLRHTLRHTGAFSEVAEQGVSA